MKRISIKNSASLCHALVHLLAFNCILQDGPDVNDVQKYTARSGRLLIDTAGV